MKTSKISKEEVIHVAHLARLEFDEAQAEKFTAQLNDILLYIGKLSEVDTTGVPPVTHAIARANAFRDDQIADSLAPDESLANAPEARGGCFVVPKVID